MSQPKDKDQMNKYKNKTCWEPARGVPPVAKVMMSRGPTGKGESGLKGASLDLLVHLPPKPESACLAALCLAPIFLTLTGAIPYHLSLENLELQLTVFCI